MTDILDEARAMLEGVTEGPWKVTTCVDYWVEPVDAPDDGGFHGIAHCGDISWPGGESKQREWEKNARFLAWCRGPDTGVPALIERVAALEAENKRLREGLGVLINVASNLLPSGVALDNTNVPDAEQIPVDFSVGEIRAAQWNIGKARAILAKGGSDAL